MTSVGWSSAPLSAPVRRACRFARHLRGEAAVSSRDKTSDSKLELPTHGAATLPSVTVDSYNIEVRDEDGFIGDKASKGAFWNIVEKWRKAGGDPFGKTTTEELTKKQLVNELEKGDPEAAGVVQSAVEEFSQQFAEVIRRFLKTKKWRDTEAIVIGGGFRGSRLGELVVAVLGCFSRPIK